MALSHIGSEARVSSISPPDGSVEAGHCADFYDMARTEMLEPGNWNFALKRVLLAQTTNLSTTWAYAYVKPSDCQRALRVLRPNVTVTVFTQDTVGAHTDDRDSAAFDLEGDVLYSNEPDAVLIYTRDVIDTNRFPASFTSALSYLLAAYLAGPILKGNEGVRVGDAMRQRAMSLADVSATSAANASSAENSLTSSIVAVRA
jgi:hypothetical protein